MNFILKYSYLLFFLSQLMLQFLDDFYFLCDSSLWHLYWIYFSFEFADFLVFFSSHVFHGNFKIFFFLGDDEYFATKSFEFIIGC